MSRLKMKNNNIILTEKQKIYRHYHKAKLINKNILQVKKYCRLIKVELQNKLQAKLNFSPLEKAFQKQVKTIENQGEQQIKATEEHGKQAAECNAFVGKDSLPSSKQKEIFYKLVAKRMKITQQHCF